MIGHSKLEIEDHGLKPTCNHQAAHIEEEQREEADKRTRRRSQSEVAWLTVVLPGWGGGHGPLP